MRPFSRPEWAYFFLLSCGTRMFTFASEELPLVSVAVMVTV
jgi:hypothetical protein